MSLLEALRSALDNLASHKLRSALTMLGMIFGVGAVIAMLSIGSGAESQAMETIDRAVSDLYKNVYIHLILHTLGADDHDRATRVKVSVNGAKEPIELELSDDDRRKSVLRLPKPQRIRILTVEIVDRVRGSRWPGAVGFSEIELLLER